MNTYLCDKRFHTEFIEDLFVDHKQFGIIMISGEITEMYRVNGTRSELVDKITVHRQKRQKKGGQSAHRFQFIRLEQINQYVKKISERINSSFVDSSGVVNIVGLIIAGMGDVKDQVIVSDHLNKRINIVKNMTIANFSIIEVIKASVDVIKNASADVENKTADRFYDLLTVGDTKLVYGPQVVKRCIREGLVKELLVHESVKMDMKTELEMAESLGCVINTITIMNRHSDNFISGYGGILAITWFDVAEYSGEMV
ncbi:MAG: peptide chain release factor eRF1/aRF1 [Faunusvirus sp.]|jgi:peptide chain release factor subunit 1|uniref:Peptide chain release factor eRF1/aRF1 n=1 Tax=Faunusvirus sp. TaxID=2487766 RepID=A0A3G4ZXN7_9VIRU|nr:MAG: peptide chain release factor eRF1/aRF1 [Faunusvirus sp.]